jgi:tRNA(fMet)-specific endonuclease VapC
VLAELYDWVLRRPDPDEAHSAVDKLLHYEVAVLDFDQDCALQYGRLRVDLRRQGIEVAAVDLMIGAVALVYDFTLVTHNTRDFRHTPGLRLADWLTP